MESSQVVEAGSKNIEVAVMKRGEELRILDDAEVEKIVSAIEEEKAKAEAEAKEKKKRELGTQ
jgi:20S proteasome subunit alpha 4